MASFSLRTASIINRPAIRSADKSNGPIEQLLVAMPLLFGSWDFRNRSGLGMQKKAIGI
jgi:hypothetical protein